MSVYTGQELLSGAESLVEIVSCNAGELTVAQTVEVQAPRSEYRYELEYDQQGRIKEAKSWKYDPESDEYTFTRFSARGNQLSRYVQCPSLGTTAMYNAANNLVSSSHTQNGGKVIERIQYGDKEEPISSAVVDREANTHTLTLFQNDGSQVSWVTPWEGPDGWTSTVYPPAAKK